MRALPWQRGNICGLSDRHSEPLPERDEEVTAHAHSPIPAFPRPAPTAPRVRAPLPRPSRSRFPLHSTPKHPSRRRTPAGPRSGPTTSTGSAGALPSSSNWIFDIGHSYPGGPGNWGTGEIAAHTNNPANVSVDGARQPADHAAARRRRQLDLGPHRDPAHRLQAAGRRRAAHRGPHPDAERHRQRGTRLLAGVLGARLAVPRQLLELAGHRRVRHHGERQRDQLRVGRAPLWSRRRAARATRPTASAPAAPCPGSTCQSGVPHLPVRVGPERLAQPAALVRRRPAVPQRQPGPAAGRHVEPDDQPRRLLHHPQRRDGRRLPERRRRLATPRWPRPCRAGRWSSTTWRCGPAAAAAPTDPPPGRRQRLRPDPGRELPASRAGCTVDGTTDAGGGSYVGSAANGDWARYDGVDFGSTPATPVRRRAWRPAPRAG